MAPRMGPRKATPEAVARLFGGLRHRLEAGHVIRHDLQDQQDGDERAPGPGACEERLQVRGVALEEAEHREEREDREQAEGADVLERRREADAAEVQEADGRGHQEAGEKAKQEDRLTTHLVELHRVEAWNHPGQEHPHRHRLPGADHQIGEDHEPAGDEADGGREHALGIGDLPARVGQRRHQTGVGEADGEQRQGTQQETESPAHGAAPPQEIVEDDEPARPHHRAEAEGEVLDGAQPAVEPEGPWARGSHGGCADSNRRMSCRAGQSSGW